MELKFYVDFMSHEEAQKGFDILLDYATRNNNFLSYNEYRNIVHGKSYNLKPTYGWTVEMLMEYKILPNYHMFALELPYPEYIEK